MKKFTPFIFLLVFSIPLFYLGIKDVHGLGDDFAQYVKEADNISKGKPYFATNWVFNELDWGYGPPQYPPGYPLLLAPVVHQYGIAIRPMLYLNGLLASGLLFALFFYFRKYASDIAAVCLSLIMVYSHELLDAKGQLLSDMPCTLFTVTYLAIRNSASFTAGRISALVSVATMVILIRSQGLVILAAEGLFLLIAIIKIIKAKQFSPGNLKKLPSVWIIAGTLLLYLLINRLILHAPESTVGYYSGIAKHMDRTLWETVKSNFGYLQEIFFDLLHYPTRMYFRGFASFLATTGSVFALIGFLISIVRKVRVDDLFFMLMCGVIIIMPIHQGARFMYEAFPVYLLYGYTGIRFLLPWFLRKKPAITAVAITALYLFIGIDDFKKMVNEECRGCVPDPFTIAIFDYLNAHMNDSDVVVCPRPRLITLYTNKQAVVYASKATDAENKKKFDDLNVKYIIPWFDGNLKKFMRAMYVPLDSQKTGDCFVYRVR